jgi:hypothetical protein
MAEEQWGERAVETVRKLIKDAGFVRRHCRQERDFTRRRLLAFDTVVLLILQKTLKSIQVHLQEFFATLGRLWRPLATPTHSAWTQARAKLRHTAFIELNQAAVLEVVAAAPEPLARWRGHRLLAIDGSILRLPETAELFAHFGGQEPLNQSGPCDVRVPQARLSLLYDCLNRLILDAQVGGFREGEGTLARAHLDATCDDDVLLLDRGYAGYLLLATLVARRRHFVIRCNTASFAPAAQLFARNQEGVSMTVTLPAKSRAADARARGLPGSVQVRFVSLRLSTGELEVLVTSLLDPEAYPTAELLQVYYQRWAVETCFGLLKGRLDLENFSGCTVEAILQEVHAAVFLSNLESMVTRPAAAQLATRPASSPSPPAPRQVNRAISFHALKDKVIDLLIGTEPTDQVLADLKALFLANPTTIRPHRHPPRLPSRPLRSLHFQKRIRKIVF